MAKTTTDEANERSIDALLVEQCARYPHLEARDLVKALYQSAFGCGHFVSDVAEGESYLAHEAEACLRACRESEPPFLEKLGARFCRVHLPRIQENGLSTRTLFRLFALSAREPAGDTAAFRTALMRVETLAASGAFPFGEREVKEFLDSYRQAGCPATHHSESFRQAYAPAYRVVSAELGRLMPVLTKIDRLLARKGRAIVAIDGDSASGKTSLAARLQAIYDCNVFHMDDFFLRPSQKTPERLAQPGGNVDRERFEAEVLDFLLRGEAFAYRPYDCHADSLGKAISVVPKALTVVEGAYSMHPALERAYDLSVFLSIDEASQRERILRRNGTDMLARFQNEWIPLEKRYFEQTGTPERCSIRLVWNERA